MLELIISDSCGNAPKQAFLRELNVAFARADIRAIAQAVTDDIRWHLVGDRLLEGKDAFLAALEEMKTHEATALTLHAIITHGREGAVHGEIALGDGATYAFCDVYTFSGAKGDRVKAITSFVINANQA